MFFSLEHHSKLKKSVFVEKVKCLDFTKKEFLLVRIKYEKGFYVFSLYMQGV